MYKIDVALILCAGYGKRLNPLTLNTPKPLLKINNLTLLENSINLIKYLGIKKIKLNTFYLKNKIKSFIEEKNFNIDIEIIEDGNEILDTGGGILNMMKASAESESNFLVLNSDTLWGKNYTQTINEMINFHFSNLNNNTLLVVDKNLSFDKNLNGDFSLDNNKIIKNLENNYIFTGCQIINKKAINKNFLEPSYNFSILKIWNNLIQKKILFGYESKNDFHHVTDLNTYYKLLKNY